MISRLFITVQGTQNKIFDGLPKRLFWFHRDVSWESLSQQMSHGTSGLAESASGGDLQNPPSQAAGTNFGTGVLNN
jgi:hypothetical protein